jgi:hypothetical protein
MISYKLAIQACIRLAFQVGYYRERISFVGILCRLWVRVLLPIVCPFLIHWCTQSIYVFRLYSLIHSKLVIMVSWESKLNLRRCQNTITMLQLTSSWVTNLIQVKFLFVEMEKFHNFLFPTVARSTVINPGLTWDTGLHTKVNTVSKRYP